MVILAAAMTTSAIVSAQQTIFDGSASAIRAVVSGKTCKGKDIIRFGEISADSAGAFERVGRAAGVYRVGYGTILIRRGDEMHGHVTSVSVPDHVLYLSTGKYQC
jgi:hypothetical protein